MKQKKRYYVLCVFVSLLLPGVVSTRVFAETLHFTDVTKEAGFAPYSNAESFSAAAADFNLDGYPDIAVSRHGQYTLSLFVNQRDGTFREANHVLEGFETFDSHGISFIDINNDNRSDLLVSCGAERGRGQGENRYFQNIDGTALRRMPTPLVLGDPSGRGRSITPIDLNKDRFVDLLVTNFFQEGRPHRVAVAVPGNTLAYTDVAHELGIDTINADGMKVVNLNNNEQIFLIASGVGTDAGNIYQKDGAAFVDVTTALGVSKSGWASVVPFDYDNDGDLDLLYLKRTFFRPSGVEIHQGEINFLLKASKSRVLQGFSCPTKNGNIVANILFEGSGDHPEFLQLGVHKQPASELPWRGSLLGQALQGEPQIDQQTDKGAFLWRDSTGALQFRFVGSTDILQATSGVIRHEAIPFTTLEKINISPAPILLPNTLYRNDNGKFTEVTSETGIRGNGLGSEAVAADFNNDGYLDVYQVNLGYSFDASNPPDNLFLNNGNGTFREVATLTGATGTAAGVGTGVIALDYDQDGDLDIFLYNGLVTPPLVPGPLMLLRNDTPRASSHSIQLDFKGTSSTARAWGVQVRSVVGGKLLYLQKHGLNGYLSTSDLPLHLGLGEAGKADEITISWPSGRKQTLKDVPAGTRKTIIEE